jgi:hypothetical protein
VTRARDIADQQDNLGGAVAPFVAGKNYVINGGFDIWQRGTSFVNPATYTADRWYNAVGGATISRQSTGAPIGSQYYVRTTSTSSSSYTDYAYYFETSQIAPLWGKTVTYSFKVRKSGVAFVDNFIVNLQKSSTVDAGSGATWTTIISGTANTSVIASGTTSSDWSTFTFTGVVPNDGTANSLRFVAGFGSPQVSGVVIDLAQVQLEIGSVATPFSRAGGSIGGELTLCQRYYWRAYGNAANMNWALGQVVASGYSITALQNPVEMRVPATAIDWSGAISFYDPVAAVNYSVTTVTTIDNTARTSIVRFNTSSLSNVGRVGYLNGGSTQYIGFSAEL